MNTFNVSIRGTEGDYYIVADDSNFENRIHKSIIEENNFTVRGNTLTLTKAVYDNYFGESVKNQQERITKKEYMLFLNSFDTILSNSRTIIENPEYYHCRSINWYIGNYLTGTTYITLGRLLELWNADKFKTRCGNCGGSVYIFRIGGSILSGTCRWTGWCPICKEEVRGGNKEGKGLGGFYKEIDHPLSSCAAKKDGYKLDRILEILSGKS